MRGDSLKTMHFHWAALCACPQLKLSPSGSSFFDHIIKLELI